MSNNQYRSSYVPAVPDDVLAPPPVPLPEAPLVFEAEPEPEPPAPKPKRRLAAAKTLRHASPYLDGARFDEDGRIPPGAGRNAVEVYYERFPITQNAARLDNLQEDDLIRACPDLERLREVVIAYSRRCSTYRPKPSISNGASMNRTPDCDQIVASLRQHVRQTGQELPAPAYDIAFREQQGVITDLESGERFVPTDNWRDFAACWIRQRTRRGRPVTVEALAAALQRSGDCLTPGPTAEYCLRGQQ